jgi:hypothetical protein
MGQILKGIIRGFSEQAKLGRELLSERVKKE